MPTPPPAVAGWFVSPTSPTPWPPPATTLRRASTTAGGFAALRIFMGLVWVSNALAKVFNQGNVDWGFSFNLITRDAAQRIATDAASKTQIAPLGTFYRDVVVANWGFFGIFQTLAELAVAIGLLFGIASRLAAVGGLLLLTPIWVMLWHTNLYLWSTPSTCFRCCCWPSCPPVESSDSTTGSPHVSAVAGRSEQTRGHCRAGNERTWPSSPCQTSSGMVCRCLL